MPLYVCNSVPGAIAESVRASIAKDVTDIHCEITGAPSTFVHVFFFEDAPQQPLHGRSAVLFGNIRAGRTDTQKRTMIDRMRRSICRHSGLTIDEVIVETTDVPAGWVMEGGTLLPEPGDEEQWLAVHGGGQ